MSDAAPSTPPTGASPPSPPSPPPPPPPPPRPDRSRAVAVAALVAVVLLAVAVFALSQNGGGEGAVTLDETDRDAGRIGGQNGTDAPDGLTIDPDTGAVVIDLPPIGGGEWNSPPEPGTPDRYSEPVPCNGFSDEVLADLGSDGEPVPDGLPRDHPHEPMRCRFDGLTVYSYTFTATDDGGGAAAVWDEFEFELMYRYGIPELGDGAGLNESTCEIVVASSNVALVMWGDGGDPRTCDEYLVRLAEDFVAETAL